MTATPFPLAPAAPLARTAFLALPHLARAAGLARAWFPEAEWVREPGRAQDRQSPVGARFRGMAAESVAVPGELRLTWAAHLEGPLSADELAALGVAWSGQSAVLRLRVAPGSPHDPRLLAWLRAAARRAGGAVLFSGADGGSPATLFGGADGGIPASGLAGAGPIPAGTVERVEPESAVELTVFSAVPVSPEVTLGLVRAVVPSARVTAAPEPDEGIAPYAIELPTQFDGTVELRFARAGELPVCLLGLDWREYGPFAYRAVWLPPAELMAGHHEALVRVARARVRPVLARAAFAIQRAASGSVVDEDGFVVTHDELVARAVAM